MNDLLCLNFHARCSLPGQYGKLAITVSNYGHASSQDIIYTVKNGFGIAYTEHIAFTYTVTLGMGK
jgi:hypothetical protein